MEDHDDADTASSNLRPLSLLECTIRVSVGNRTAVVPAGNRALQVKLKGFHKLSHMLTRSNSTLFREPPTMHLCQSAIGGTRDGSAPKVVSDLPILGA